MYEASSEEKEPTREAKEEWMKGRNKRAKPGVLVEVDHQARGRKRPEEGEPGWGSCLSRAVTRPPASQTEQKPR